MLHTSFVEIGQSVPEKKIFKCFYHTWAWWPSWSCDPDAENKLSFLIPIEDSHKIGFDWPSGLREEDV